MHPRIFFISDSGIQYTSKETISLYRRNTPGIQHKGMRRRVITTRRDGYINFTIGLEGARINTAR